MTKSPRKAKGKPGTPSAADCSPSPRTPLSKRRISIKRRRTVTRILSCNGSDEHNNKPEPSGSASTLDEGTAENPFRVAFDNAIDSQKRYKRMCTAIPSPEKSPRKKLSSIVDTIQPSPQKKLSQSFTDSPTTPALNRSIARLWGNLAPRANRAGPSAVAVNNDAVAFPTSADAVFPVVTEHVRLLKSSDFGVRQLTVQDYRRGLALFTSGGMACGDWSIEETVASCLYRYQYPVVPCYMPPLGGAGVPRLPRLNGRNARQLELPLAQRQDMEQTWNDCFLALFHDFIDERPESGCRQFHVIGDTASVLFTTLSNGEKLAVATPVKPSVKQALTREHVKFTTPAAVLKSGDENDQTATDSGLFSLSSISPSSPADCGKENDVSRNAEENDDSDSDAADFPSPLLRGRIRRRIPRPQTSPLTRSGLHKLEVDDSTPSTLVVREDSLRPLASFLTAKAVATLMPKSGPTGGCVPTLLASVPFENGTLVHAKVRTDRQHVAGKLTYSVDIYGPILPDLLARLAQVLKPDSTEWLNLDYGSSFAPFVDFRGHVAEVTRANVIRRLLESNFSKVLVDGETCYV